MAPLLVVVASLLSAAVVEGSIFSVGPRSTAKPDLLYKGFSGLRAYDRSTRVVYYHDQTVAVVELGPDRLLLSCELIEVYEPSHLEETLEKVSEFAKPHRIKFDLMMDLMDRCSRIETPAVARRFTVPTESGDKARGASSILSGVVPGTKWCGAGDLADTYFDLGQEEALDRCCRTHDLCPSKIRGHSARYDISNDNMYTKSHCKCDARFQKCLKRTNSSTADIIGHFYFDLLKVPCVADRKGVKFIRPADSYSKA